MIARNELYLLLCAAIIGIILSVCALYTNATDTSQLCTPEITSLSKDSDNSIKINYSCNGKYDGVYLESSDPIYNNTYNKDDNIIIVISHDRDYTFRLKSYYENENGLITYGNYSTEKSIIKDK